MRDVMIEKTCAKDMIPIFSGYEICEPQHKYGPHTRNYYLIHFCLKGSGELLDKFGRHRICAGELFIIRPGEITTYVADEKDPWTYAWLAFHGDMASVFDTDRSTYAFPMEIGTAVRELAQKRVTSAAIFTSLLYELIYRLFSEKKKSRDLVEELKRYIKFNYMNDLTVSELSAYFGFERSYLYRVFKRACGLGIKQYVIKTRMEQARMLLGKGYSVEKTALAVGYGDPFNFSKAFKKHFGVSPKAQKPG